MQYYITVIMDLYLEMVMIYVLKIRQMRGIKHGQILAIHTNIDNIPKVKFNPINYSLEINLNISQLYNGKYSKYSLNENSE